MKEIYHTHRLQKREAGMPYRGLCGRLTKGTTSTKHAGCWERLEMVGNFLPEGQSDVHSKKNEGISLVCSMLLGHSQDRTRRGTCGRDQPPHTVRLFSWAGSSQTVWLLRQQESRISSLSQMVSYILTVSTLISTPPAQTSLPNHLTHIYISLQNIPSWLSPVLCGAQLLSCVQLFSTPWALAQPTHLSLEILQSRILE